MDEEAASGEKTEPKRGRAFLFLIFVLVGALCFEAGLLAQVWPAEKSIEIKLAEVSASPKAPPEAVDTGKVASSSQIAEETSTATCPFVGSKNSDKYQ